MSEQVNEQVKKPKKKIKIKGYVVVLIAVVAVGGFWYSQKEKQKVSAEPAYTEIPVSVQDISVTISASGTLQAADSYNVTSLVKGEVLSAPFEEGDVIKKGTLLFQLDASDVENNIKKSELSLERSQLSYSDTEKTLSDLTINANESGVITKLHVATGDSVQNGTKIADIQERDHMKLKVSVNANDMASVYEGQNAEITMDGSFETISGTVESISIMDNVLASGAIVREVTLKVKNPGGLSVNLYATAKIGNVAATSGGNFENYASTTVTSGAAGKVSELFCQEGGVVKDGDTLLNLTSTSLDSQIRNNGLSLEDAQLSLESSRKQLDNYKITAPITGTVIEKNFKAGDKIDTNNAGTMAVIYDLSSLTFDMSVDELDIGKIRVGQKVSVTSDAVKGKSYTGEISKISINGKSSNGVTSYPATVVIKETEGLLPGMNINAEVVVEEKLGVLAVPVNAVERGNTVLLKSKDGAITTAPVEDKDTAEKPATTKKGAVIPAGYVSTKVEVGINNNKYIEILSGLQEGDTICVVTVKKSTNMSDMMFIGPTPTGSTAERVPMSGSAVSPQRSGGK